MIQAALNFFFNMISWVFNYFLIEVKILGISILYYFFGILILSILFSALINSVKAKVPKSKVKTKTGGSNRSKGSSNKGNSCSCHK